MKNLIIILVLLCMGCASVQPSYKVVYHDPIPALQLELITAVSVKKYPGYSFCARKTEYKMFSRDQLHPLISKCRTHNLTYLKEARNCADFALIMDAWISEAGYGNYAFGRAWAVGKEGQSHEFCLVLLDTGELVGIDATPNGSGIVLDEWEIYKVEF